VKPNSSTIAAPRSLKEPLTPAQLSVRDQAIERATKAIAAARGAQKHEVAITSGYRSNSRAHMRGAFDVSVKSSKNPAKDAAAVAKSLGPGFVTIHEKPSADGKTQTNTSYFHDGSSKTTTRPYGSEGFRAKGEHIHVQPNDVLNQPDAGRLRN
jgi:hypothetical protein